MPDSLKINIDASHMRFDPSDSKFLAKICADIPAFGEFSAPYVDTDIGKTKLYQWIVIMYDPNSPLRREIKDLFKRKVYAGNLVGFKPHSLNGKYREWIEDMLVGQNRDVNNLIVRFISSFASPEYMQFMAHVTLQNSMLEKIIANEADKNVQVMFDLSTDKIKELTNILYGTGERDEVYEARRALYKQVAYDLTSMRPESVAKTLITDDKLPDEWNPYGDYIPGDINFVGDNIDIARDDEESLP